MKLLLTSWGITNKSIEKTLFDLVWKKAEDTTVVFIPTASNVEIWDKSWFINDLIKLKSLNFKSIEITDISAVNKNIWLESFKRADVLFFEWWNAYYLMEQINKSWLKEEIWELLKNKVYLWVSAWSMIASPDLKLKLFKEINSETENKNIDCLNLVDFYFLPHLNSKYFSERTVKNLEKVLKNIDSKIYFLDDKSAIKIDWDKLEIISEWEVLEFN